MSPDVIRWGILGAGGIAATVAADIAAVPGHELAAVGARDAGRAEAFARTHGVARSYGSYAELVSDPAVDIVYVATTHAQHHEHALLAIAAGKAVLVEKAFTLNAAQAREVVAAARSAGVFCMEAMWMRFNPLVREMRRLIDSRALGDLVSVRAEFSKPFAFDPAHRLFDLAAGGGALLDLGVYPVTFAWLMHGAPEAVDAIGTRSPTGSDATVAMQWRYADGVVAQLLTSAVSPSPFGALVCGTDGWARLSPRVHAPEQLTVSTAGDERTQHYHAEGNGYREQVEEVGRCLREDRMESDLVPLDETVGILELLDDVRRQVGVRYPVDPPAVEGTSD